jgi:acetyltransferase-like isoleucine patch superfamily enzyme
VTISPGTIIREGAIIGLGSTIWGEIGNCQVIGSEKPKVIKLRNKIHYEYLKNNQH